MPEYLSAAGKPHWFTSSSSHSSKSPHSVRSTTGFVLRRLYSCRKSGNTVSHTPNSASANTNLYLKIVHLLNMNLESCYIALMSQSRSDGSGVERALFTLNWLKIIDLSVQLRLCFAFKPPRGGWLTVGCNFSFHLNNGDRLMIIVLSAQ